jgi:phage terminase large subunit-like protein
MARAKHQNPPDYAVRTLADRNAIAAGCYWDDSHYQHFKRWCAKYAIQSDGEWTGKPIEMLDFQERDIFGPMLSWKNPNGTYRFNWSLIFSSKKIGKSTGIAALAGWRLSTRKKQDIRILASKVDQAEIIHNVMEGFRQNGVLDNRWHVNSSKYIITDRLSKSVARVMACNPSGISGPSIDLMILDETAEFPPHHAQKIWDRVKYGGAAKANSQIVSITTPAHDYAHLGYRLYQRAMKLISGEDGDDMATLPVYYGIPTECDWKDPANWLKYLPHINQTVPLSFYETEFRRCLGDPLEELGFRIYLLGQYVRGMSVFIDMAAWARCQGKFPDLNGRPAVIGLDNGGANDLLAIVALVHGDDGRLYVDSLCAMTEQALHKKNKVGQLHFQAWADRGFMEVVKGSTITLEKVTRLLDRFYDRYDVKALAYDPWQLNELEAKFSKKRRLVIETAQFGRVLSPLILEFERKVLEETLVHTGDPVMDFCIENFEVREDNRGRLEFDKKDSRSKIDLAAAAVVALNALPEIGNATTWDLPAVM